MAPEYDYSAASSDPDSEDWDDVSLRRGPRVVQDVELDITPMIDVTFLLLIFFMVTSTMDQQAKVELASARHGDAVGERESVIITVGAGGVDSAPVYLSDQTDGEPLPEDLELQDEAIRAAVESGRSEEVPKTRVLILADRNVAHRDVARVIKAASRVEGMSIHLGVHEED
ncbi:MAG: biopolymer transporter ExbD [Planctomycetota bacterium]